MSGGGVSSCTNHRADNSEGLHQRCGKKFSNGVKTHPDEPLIDLSLSSLTNGLSKLGNLSIAQLDNVHHEAKSALDEIQSKFNEDVKQLLENVAMKATNSIQATNSASTSNNISCCNVNRPQKGIITKKVFKARPSILTEAWSSLSYSQFLWERKEASTIKELLTINHIETLYNISVAVLILLGMQTVVCDLLEVGRVRLDFTLISWGFGKFPAASSIWLLMVASTLLVFPMFILWSHLRQDLQWITGLCDTTFIILYVIYICGFLAAPAWAIIDADLPPVSSFIILCEQVRLIMKTHAFIRESAPTCAKMEKDGRHHLLFSHYLYFLFAPTLVYRHEYPRTTSINWRFVISNLLQLAVCILYFYYIFMNSLVPNFQNFNRDHITMKTFAIAQFSCMMPASLCFFIAFFGLLHLWMNAWAEMLRFGDRLFYKDWWNSTSFASYHRNWNLVVHDWLYTYLYLDFYTAFGFKHRWLAMHLTFFISALVHEYIISTAFRFIYPVLFLSFELAGVGMIYILNGSWQRVSKIGIWVFLLGGMGTQMALYSMEWYARMNCPTTVSSWVDYAIPRSWHCESTSIDHLFNITLPTA